MWAPKGGSEAWRRELELDGGEPVGEAEDRTRRSVACYGEHGTVVLPAPLARGRSVARRPGALRDVRGETCNRPGSQRLVRAVGVRAGAARHPVLPDPPPHLEGAGPRSGRHARGRSAA